MDEVWERAVEAALDGETDSLAIRRLTLDGAVKCVKGRLPSPSLLERFQNLRHLSIANIDVSSLEQFPRLENLQKLILSDNRITLGLEYLVKAGLHSLRDLDLSNNRIQFVQDLAPLALLKLVSLDLYECPVTRVKDYRTLVFDLIKTLKYLDKTDAEGNERSESDDDDDDDEYENDGQEDDEEDEEEEDEESDEEDPGSGEVDGDEITEAPCMSNGHSERLELVVDEDEESDAEDEESEQATGGNGTSYRPNGVHVNGEEGEDDGDSSESGEEELEEDNYMVEVHEIEDSDDEEDGVDDEEEDDRYAEGIDNNDLSLGVPDSTARMMNVREIDGHDEQGDDDEDGDGEIGEDYQWIEDDDDDDDDGEEEDEESGEGFLLQPVSQVENCLDEEEEIEDDLPVHDQSLPASSRHKRKRDYDDNGDDDDDDDDDDGDDDNDDAEGDDDNDDDDDDDDDGDGVDDEEG